MRIYLEIVPKDGVIDEKYLTYNDPACWTSPLACWFVYRKCNVTYRHWSLSPAITASLDYRLLDDYRTDSAKRGPLGQKSSAGKYHRRKEYFSKDIA
jgi:hypothetical protein